jgi:hypothetical protein
LSTGKLWLHCRAGSTKFSVFPDSNRFAAKAQSRLIICIKNYLSTPGLCRFGEIVIPAFVEMICQIFIKEFLCVFAVRMMFIIKSPRENLPRNYGRMQIWR